MCPTATDEQRRRGEERRGGVAIRENETEEGGKKAAAITHLDVVTVGHEKSHRMFVSLRGRGRRRAALPQVWQMKRGQSGQVGCKIRRMDVARVLRQRVYSATLGRPPPEQRAWRLPTHNE